MRALAVPAPASEEIKHKKTELPTASPLIQFQDKLATQKEQTRSPCATRWWPDQQRLARELCEEWERKLAAQETIWLEREERA